MGKKGDALRAAKAQSATYTFTRAQLEEHDRKVKEAYKERVRAECKEELKARIEQHQRDIDRHIDEEWKKREALFAAEDGTNLSELLSLLLCVSSRILIEKFRWKPIPKEGVCDMRNHTVRFSQYFANEISDICTDQNKDIRIYCDETYELYGVKYEMKG